jgi:transcriptional regulator with XRE-family HTH domain
MDNTADGSARHRPRIQDPVKLRNRRIRAGLSLTSVALRIGGSKGYLSDLENPARTKSASPERLALLAEIYGCKIDDLLSDDILEDVA